MYDAVVNFVVTSLLGWASGLFVDFTGPVADLSPLAGPFRFQRYHFHGLAATLQFSADNVTWHDGLSVDFTSGSLLNILSNVQRLVNATLGAFGTVFASGHSLTLDGVTYTGSNTMLVGDVVKLIVKMTQFGEPLQIDHYFRARTTAATFGGLVTSFRTLVEPGLLLAMDTSVKVVQYNVEDRINTANPAVLRRTLQTPLEPVLKGGVHGGGGVDDSIADASQLCAIVTWETINAGRSERGRTFVPGLYHTGITGNLLNDTGRGPVQAWADSLVAAYGVEDTGLPHAAGAGVDPNWLFVLWRQKFTGAGITGSNPAHAVPATESNPLGYEFPPVTKPPFNPLAAAEGINAAIARREIHTQRRRGPGVRISRRRRA